MKPHDVIVGADEPFVTSLYCYVSGYKTMVGHPVHLWLQREGSGRIMVRPSNLVFLDAPLTEGRTGYPTMNSIRKRSAKGLHAREELQWPHFGISLEDGTIVQFLEPSRQGSVIRNDGHTLVVLPLPPTGMEKRKYRLAPEVMQARDALTRALRRCYGSLHVEYDPWWQAPNAGVREPAIQLAEGVGHAE